MREIEPLMLALVGDAAVMEMSSRDRTASLIATRKLNWNFLNFLAATFWILSSWSFPV